jgi:hypothetical protein
MSGQHELHFLVEDTEGHARLPDQHRGAADEPADPGHARTHGRAQGDVVGQHLVGHEEHGAEQGDEAGGGEGPDREVEGRQGADEDQGPPFRVAQLADAEGDLGVGVVLPPLDL